MQLLQKIFIGITLLGILSPTFVSADINDQCRDDYGRAIDCDEYDDDVQALQDDAKTSRENTKNEICGYNTETYKDINSKIKKTINTQIRVPTTCSNGTSVYLTAQQWMKNCKSFKDKKNHIAKADYKQNGDTYSCVITKCDDGYVIYKDEYCMQELDKEYESYLNKLTKEFNKVIKKLKKQCEKDGGKIVAGQCKK